MQDYNYLKTNCFEITLELGCDKFPSDKDIPRYLDENKKAIVDYIWQVSSQYEDTFENILIRW